jgi:hypothetical protein
MGLLDYQNFLINESAVFESAMEKAEWLKHNYRGMLANWLNDKSAKLLIDPKYTNKWGKSIDVSSIENLEDVKAYVNGDKIISAELGPIMKVGKNEIPLTHLLKTGQFHVPSKGSTTTDVKEGMVVYFYYNPGINIFEDTEKAAAAVSNIWNGADHPNTIKELHDWILNADDDKDTVDKVAQWQSSADALDAFRSAGYQIDRYVNYENIRKKANELCGLNYDNWNPGDFYLIDPSAISKVGSLVSNAKMIGELNLLFSDAFAPRSSSGEPIGSIVSISLKQQEARIGKAKGYLGQVSKGDTVYNLSKEEVAKGKEDLQWARNEIAIYQDKISGVSGKAGINVNYIRGDVNKVGDAKVMSKLAAIKLAYYLLTLPNDTPTNADNNLLAILGFGLKMHNAEVNPAYFKVVGQIKGSAKLEPVHSGDALALLVGGLDSSETKLVILDSDTRIDIVFFYYASIGDIAYEIKLRLATTNSTQAGVEFEGKTALGDISKDGPGTIAAINAAFAKASSK